MTTIFGANECPLWVCMSVGISLPAIVFLLFIIVMLCWNKSYFENMPDYGIKQRGDVIAAIPTYEESSLRQKVDQWTKPASTSQLTGSRDVPIFFQDYNMEANRNSNTSAVQTSREGFEGGRSDSELERALAGRN